MARDIKLDGGEITVLKQIGLSGTQMAGRVLADHVEDMMPSEFIDTLDSLVSLGYVLSSKVNIRTMEDVEHSSFRVNPTYARDLKDAIHPSRQREERRSRRERRS